MTVTWVIGSHGLLGSALLRELDHTGDRLFVPAERFRWGDEANLEIQFEKAAREFATLVGNDKSWQIFWAAGIGTMGSSRADLEPETRALSKLLGLLESEPNLISAESRFVLASSAGAIYANSKDEVVSEKSAISPTTVYAEAKLEQESLVSAFALDSGSVTALVARISTLYGPGQATGKQQGLLAHIARCILKHEAIHIYVPLDTIRDYISADDAARSMIATLKQLDGKPGVFTKIIASEKPATIAEIISIFKRISRRNPRIVTSANRLSGVYTRRMVFRSNFAKIHRQTNRTSLHIGIAQVMAAERSAYTSPGE